MNPYPEVTKWTVPRDLLSESLAEMAIDGAAGNEGICLWLGDRNETNREAQISHLVRLRGTGIKKSPWNIEIAPELMREVHHTARELGKILIGQIHSHGKDYGVDLSLVDIKYGVRIPYYLSVVAPNYGQNSGTKWHDCGAHVYLPPHEYVRTQAIQIIEIDDSYRVQIITVSDE